jgi:hypothetical protein
MDRRRAVTILDVGGMNYGCHRPAEGVPEQTALAPVDLRAGVPRVAAFIALGCSTRITVDLAVKYENPA